MITQKATTKSKRNYHQMLKETVESNKGLIEKDMLQHSNHLKKKFKHSSRDDDVDMNSPLQGNENQVVVQKTAPQVDRIKSEIEKYRNEVSRMKSAIKYCPCDYSQYYC